jgi:hypothetical protein
MQNGHQSKENCRIFLEKEKSVLTEITGQIKPLSRLEKLQLIGEISKMLQEKNDPGKYFTPGDKYPVFTPYNEEKAAARLQQFLEPQQL